MTKGRRRVLIGVGAVAVLGLLGVGGPQVWAGAASADRVRHVADAPSADVALVLGAGLSPGGGPSPFLAGRLDRAKELYDAGHVRVILVSGDNRFTNYDEPTAMYDYLVARGVPGEVIVRDYAGRSTYESCVRAKEVFGVDKALVVSQAYHLPRAVAVCRAVGVDATGVGDWTGRDIASGVWRTGQVREVPATMKAALSVILRPDPVLGPPLDDVARALAAGAPAQG